MCALAPGGDYTGDPQADPRLRLCAHAVSHPHMCCQPGLQRTDDDDRPYHTIPGAAAPRAIAKQVWSCDLSAPQAEAAVSVRAACLRHATGATLLYRTIPYYCSFSFSFLYGSLLRPNPRLQMHIIYCYSNPQAPQHVHQPTPPHNIEQLDASIQFPFLVSLLVLLLLLLFFPFITLSTNCKRMHHPGMM